MEQGKPPSGSASPEGSREDTKQAIVLLSGGIDSATCLYIAKEKYKTRAITFAFNDIAEAELKAARAVGRRAGIDEHRFVNLPDVRESGDMGVKFEGLPPTYIPMRNAIFYSLAAAYAEETGAEYLVGGHNKDDLGLFRDTSSAFFDSLEQALWAGSALLKRKRTRVWRPLGTKTKPEVVELAASIGVPLELTWSCHSPGTLHCWRCDGCRGRTAAFEKAGVRDPLKPL